MFARITLLVLDMAGNKNAAVDPAVIDRVVKCLTAKLTDKACIQALIEMPEEEAHARGWGSGQQGRPEEGAGRPARRPSLAKEIPDATAKLLEPIFRARDAGNLAFLTVYQRSPQGVSAATLDQPPDPRVQAMIVLGESGNTENIDIFEREISNSKQTLWVKLWAIEGIKKIKEFGQRMSADAEAKAAKVISDFLDNPKVRPLPWPIQLRGLDALTHLRQGFLPNQPNKAHMANTAMRFLADPQAKLEVRAEAARATRTDADQQRSIQIQLLPPGSRGGPARGRSGDPDQRPLFGQSSARGESHQGEVPGRAADRAGLSSLRWPAGSAR